MHKRNIFKEIESLALSRGKMAFISGPRQAGKTTLAKMFIKNNSGKYYNWDELDFRRLWTKSPKAIFEHLDKKTCVILDEIHKASKWKQNLKGLYDIYGDELRFIVTGSARLDLYKKGSDSLMGRYLGFRLHPFSIGELLTQTPLSPSSFMGQLEDHLSTPSTKNLREFWKNLEVYGGFPEPLFSSSTKILKLWQKGRIEKIVREDLRDLSRLPELSKIEMLISLLPEKVANPLSLTSLKEDLEVSYDSVKRWMIYLKELYYHFEVRPWSTNIARSLKKEGKIYLWDWSEVEDPGSKFENMVASHLLKACHFWTDTGEGKFELRYLKTKEKKEIDFLIIKDNRPWLPIECKLNDATPSANFRAFFPFFSVENYVQLVNKSPVFEKKIIDKKNIYISSASQFFRYLP